MVSASLPGRKRGSAAELAWGEGCSVSSSVHGGHGHPRAGGSRALNEIIRKVFMTMPGVESGLGNISSSVVFSL